MRFSNSASAASGVTSRPVKPVPPVEMITSIAGSAIQLRIWARIFSTSSVTMARPATACPAFSIRSARVEPDLSSSSFRVSEIVSPAIFNGTNGRLSSMPGMCVRPRALQRTRRKGVAGLDRALLEPGHEPALALLGRAVGEALRHHRALRLSLQRVVADRRGGLQRRVDVTRIEEALLRLGVVGPDAGEAVGLQLGAHLEPVRVGAVGGALLRLLHLGQDAEQVLHMVADLVGDHVGLRELAGLAAAAAKAPLELVEERGIEIHLAVIGTVERSHRALGSSTGRAGLP